MSRRKTLPVEVQRVYDGDTITAATVRLWPGIVISTAIRIRGIDAPEIRGGCPESRALAQKARAMLQDSLDGATVTIHDPEHGLYAGRVVATVLVDGEDVGERLIAAGLAVRYDGTARPDWCEMVTE